MENSNKRIVTLPNKNDHKRLMGGKLTPPCNERK
jgi:hypothetical protein